MNHIQRQRIQTGEVDSDVIIQMLDASEGTLGRARHSEMAGRSFQCINATLACTKCVPVWRVLVEWSVLSQTLSFQHLHEK